MANLTTISNDFSAANAQGTNNGFYACGTSGPWTFGVSPFQSASSPFQSSESANYYLAADSSFRGRGYSTNWYDPSLLALLRGRSTQPPVSIPGYWGFNQLALVPAVPRYAGGQPDLGYFYDALDYTISGLGVACGALTISPGTAIAVRKDVWVNGTGDKYWVACEGICLLSDSSLMAVGQPANPITFTESQMVQEGPFSFTGYGYESTTVLFVPDSSANPPSLTFRFANFCLPGESYHFWCGFPDPAVVNWDDYANETGYFGYGFIPPCSTMNLTLQDCQLLDGYINLGPYSHGGPWSGGIIWSNNLLDRVNCYLSPNGFDVYVDPTVVADMGFQAYNNLFHGGQLHLEPYVVTTGWPAGNWVLRDNLFDQVTFIQGAGAAQPLDNDHNGYWPATPYLTAGTGGQANHATDIGLTAAPPYQTSLYGQYYLPTTSPLYGAGSRSPASAGLYHYTTRTSQTEEGDEPAGHQVNIGLHYVAGNTVTGAPRDTDGDRVLDYIEDANGNGAMDANETSPAAPTTVPGVSDPSSPVYDDVDLSGDGLVGRVKKALLMPPFDSSNPLTLTLSASSAGPNTVVFQAPLNFTLLGGVGHLVLLVDGYPAPLQTCQASSSGSCLLAWDITYEQAGWHFFQAELVLDGQFPPGAVTKACGPIICATVQPDSPPYTYTMTPFSADDNIVRMWYTSTADDRIASVMIPASQQQSMNSWQLFGSVLANPYLRAMWRPGESMDSCYAAAKVGTITAITTVENSTDFSKNVLRYLGSLDIPYMASVNCYQCSAPYCWLDYAVVCEMATQPACLNALSDSSLHTLFGMAVWDAAYFLSTQDYIVAAAPIKLMIAIKRQPGFTSAAPLPDLSVDDIATLDVGCLPLVIFDPSDPASSPVFSAVASLGLHHRP